MANIDVYSLTLPNDNNAYWLKDKSLQDAKGAANGIAELDSTGKVPSSQLPSYVDDVIEVADYSHLPITGETGKIYVTIDDNKTYRWSGTGYTEISSSLALGETSSTAYRGDRGKTAYDHSQVTSGNPHFLPGFSILQCFSSLKTPSNTSLFTGFLSEVFPSLPALSFTQTLFISASSLPLA